jgi:hypothetical protein
MGGLVKAIIIVLCLLSCGGCAQLLVTRAHDASTDRVLALMPTHDGRGAMVGVDFTKLRKGYLAAWKDSTPTMVGATVVDTLTAGMIYYLSTKDKSNGGTDTPDSNSGVVIINNGGTVNYRYEVEKAEQTAP